MVCRRTSPIRGARRDGSRSAAMRSPAQLVSVLQGRGGGLQRASCDLPLLLWAIATCDIFIFGFASTFFGYLELPLLKLFRRRVVFIFHGSDSRPPYLDGAVPTADAGSRPDALVRSTRRVKRRVRTIDRWADVVVDNPLSAHFHERPIVSFLAIGIPRVLASGDVRSRSRRGSRAPLSFASRREGIRRDSLGASSVSGRATSRSSSSS